MEDVVSVRVRLREGAKFSVETRKAAHDVDELGDAAQRADRKAKGAATSFDLVQRTIRLIKPAVVIAGVGLLGQTLSAATAGAIGLTAALVPLGGLLGALPALGLIAAQGMGVTALSLMGVKDAVGGLNSALDPEKFAALQRPAQDFALALDSMKAPIRDLQSSIQSEMLPGLTAGLKSALPAVAALRGPLMGTAGIFGHFGEQLGRLVGSRGFLTDLRTQAEFNNVQLSRMSGAGLSVVNILRNLSVAARPLVSWIVRLVTGWALSADRATALGRASGGLAKGFHTIQVTASRVVRIIGDLAVALFNIGRSGKKNLGDSLLVSLVRGAQALRDWTESASGIQKINGYFAQARPVVYAVGRLFKAIALEFLGMGAGGPGMALLIDRLTALVPVLGDVVSGTTAAFGPTMIAAISAFAKAFAPLAGSSGPLVLLVTGMTMLARAAFWVEQNVPGATVVLSTLIGVLAINRALGFARALRGIGFAASPLARALGFLVRVTTDLTRAQIAEMATGARLRALWIAFKESTFALRLQLIALRVQQILTGSTATAMWAAITGPIGLTVLGVLAVAAAFVLAYNKVRWFHDAVDNTIGFIRDHWPLLLAILTGPFGLAVLYISRHFDSIVGFVTGMPARIASAASGMWDGLKSGLTSALNWIIDKINMMIRAYNKLPLAPDIGQIGRIGGPAKSGHNLGASLLGNLAPQIRGAKAIGGPVWGSGNYLVGERGPEVVRLRAGWDVIANNDLPHMAAPRVASVPSAGPRDGSGRPIQINLKSELKLADGRVIADSVDQVVSEDVGRA